MPTSPFRESRGATTGDQDRPSAASRGRRLGRNARRDIRWAMQQQPNEYVRHVTLHGVRITFSNQGADSSQDTGMSQRQVPPESQTTPHAAGTPPPPNSRQRRSRARLQKYLASKSSTVAAGDTSGAMQLEPPPSGSGAAAAPAPAQPVLFTFGNAPPAPGSTSFVFGDETAAQAAAPNAAQDAVGESGRGGGNHARQAGGQGCRRKGRGGSK